MRRFLAELTDPRHAVTVSFAGLLVFALAVRLWLTDRFAAPQLVCDEFIYAEISKNLLAHGEPLMRHQASWQNVLYPALIAPSWLADSMETAYGIAKGINAFLMTLTAVPVYLWARRLTSPGYALLASALTLVMPAFVYTGLLMTENAFLPAFVLAAYAIALAVERPTARRQLFALATIATAAAARTQGIVLLLVFASAIALKLLFDVRARGEQQRRLFVRELRVYAPALGVLVAVGGLYLVATLATGRSVTAAIGAYQEVAQTDYSSGEAIRWSLYHFEEFALSVGVIPLSALIVLLGLAVSRAGRLNAHERAFVAVSVSALVWTTIQVGLFASQFALRIMERYMLYLVPLVVLALVLWLHRGLERPRVWTAIALALPAAAVTAFPLPTFLSNAIYDSFTLYALAIGVKYVAGNVAGLEDAVTGAIAAFALFFAIAPRRLATVALPALLGALFIGFTRPAFDFVSTFSQSFRPSPAVGQPALSNPGWIDETLPRGARADLIFSPVSTEEGLSSVITLETEFWNKRVDDVYATVGSAEVCPLPEKQLRTAPATGALVGADGRPPPLDYVVADLSLTIRGRLEGSQTPFGLFHVHRPPKLVSRREGIYPDEWTSSEAAYTQYESPGGRPGRVKVVIGRLGWTGRRSTASIAVGPLALDAGGSPSIKRVLASRRWTVKSESWREFDLPAPRPPFRVEVRITPIEAPQTLGTGADPRGLGAIARFAFVPSSEQTSRG